MSGPWAALRKRHVEDAQALVELTAMAWRQAAASNRSAIAEFLATQRWSTEQICNLLDSWNVEPDVDTREWAGMR